MKTKPMRLLDDVAWDTRPKGSIVEVLLPESYDEMDALRKQQGLTSWTLAGRGAPASYSYEVVVLTLDRKDYWYYYESGLEEV